MTELGRPRVVHVINNLVMGGAEHMLVRLVTALREEFDQSVICILDRGPLAGRLESAQVPVHALGASRRLPNPLVVVPLLRALRKARPDVVQTWLYQSDVLGGLAARIGGFRNVVWNLRSADVSRKEAHPATRVAIRVGALLSRRVPARIVCCAESVRTVHAEIGYDVSRAICIPNGVDLLTFAPDAGARARVRAQLGIAQEAPLIGLFARLNPQKDHRTFFAAAERLHARRSDAHFVLAGTNIEPGNPKMRELMGAQSLPSQFHLLGERTDLPALTAALDVASSSSAWGEGFPNVIAEAMACAVPCVATDAGDAAILIGDTGIVVGRRDPNALADAWEQLLSQRAQERTGLGARARKRVEERFDFRSATRQYADLYRQLAQGR